MTFSPAVRRDVLTALRLVNTVSGAAAGGPQTQETLEQFLYVAWFSQAGRFGSDGDEELRGWPTIVARLRAAHPATSRLELGWHAVGTRPGGVVIATRDGEYVELLPGDYVSVAHPGTPVRAGAALAVSRRRDVVNADGWWVTSGSVGSAPGRDLVRMYWNCPAAAAPSLVAALTGVLEDAGSAYTLKCPSTAQLFNRADSCVLYLGIDTWRVTARALREVHERIAARLRRPIPPLTLGVGPGVALAEDPANGQSFGQSRVRAVADGLLTAALRRVVDDDAVLEVVAERLLANGIDPARPYLAAGSPPDRLLAR